MKNKPKTWTTPKIMILRPNVITSGNSNDTRIGEFIAPFDGTSCPFTTQQCITYNELGKVYSTGKIDSKAVCYSDNYIDFELISFCS